MSHRQRPHLWNDRPVLVTGASGLLGSWLVARLLEQGARVVVLLRDLVPDALLETSGDRRRATTVLGDVRDGGLVERVLAEYEIDAVFHLAAQTIVEHAARNPVGTFRSNIEGTWEVLDACRRSGRTTRIVVASSDKAYGEQQELPYREEQPLQGSHPYDVSKSCTDLIAQSYAWTYGLPVVVTRCGNLYGGGDLNFNRLIPGSIRDALSGRAPTLRSDGTPLRDYLYVEDAARRLHGARAARARARDPRRGVQLLDRDADDRDRSRRACAARLRASRPRSGRERLRDARDPRAAPLVREGPQHCSAGRRPTDSHPASSAPSRGTPGTSGSSCSHMLRDALREALAAAEEQFAAGDLEKALIALEDVRRAASPGSRVWAEAMADIAVVLHAGGEPYDAYVHARRALEAVPELEEARETAMICAASLGLAGSTEARGDRTLIVVDNFFPSRGGTEVLAQDLALSMTALGHPVEILCRSHPGRKRAGNDLQVHEFEPSFAEQALAALLRERRFGAVIGISVPMGFPVVGVLRFPTLAAGVRSLVVPCVNEEVDATVRASSDLMSRYARLLHRVDAVGFSSRDGWDRRLLDDLGVAGVYLPNAVPTVEPTGDIRAALGVARDTRIILHVANFWPQKNHLAFLEHMRAAPGDWRLVCLGGPSADHPLLRHAVAAAAACDPRVSLVGDATREEVAGAMRQADVLVLPSIAEATPLVLLEAMSNGLPWIASDTCRSAADLAGGSIVPQGGFANEIERLLTDEAARTTLAEAGRAAYAAGYSWESVAPRYVAALGLPVAAGLAMTG